jgi:hypothetical protein
VLRKQLKLIHDSNIQKLQNRQKFQLKEIGNEIEIFEIPKSQSQARDPLFKKIVQSQKIKYLSITSLFSILKANLVNKNKKVVMATKANLKQINTSNTRRASHK